MTDEGAARIILITPLYACILLLLSARRAFDKIGGIGMIGRRMERSEVGTRFGLLFEFENMAVTGRRATYEVLKQVMGRRGVGLDLGVFVKHCLYSCPRCFVPSVLGAVRKSRVPADRVIREVHQGLTAALMDGYGVLNPELDKVLARAAAEKIPIGALTCLDGSVADRLMSLLGLDARGIVLFKSDSCDRGMPTPDCWLRLARQVEVLPTRCMVLASSAVSCKSALMAGMCCTAVPDEFTACDDFGGADFVMDSLDPSVLEDMKTLLRSRQL